MQPDAPPLTDHQADQLGRLRSIFDQYPHMLGRFCCVYQQGVRESDVPSVYRELRDLGLVTVTFSDSKALVALVNE